MLNEPLDTYGYPVDPKTARHDRCECVVPCQKTFRCRSRHHEGSAQTPYCKGGEGESCDDCWYAREVRNAASRMEGTG